MAYSISTRSRSTSCSGGSCCSLTLPFGVRNTLAAGLSRGARASVVAAFGCTLGIVPHMAAAIMGLAALLHTSALAFQTFKYLGVAYLLYMAWSTLREHGALKVEQGDSAPARPSGDVTAS
jgi:threonine/homoserine/homoserine lactone efflux protein